MQRHQRAAPSTSTVWIIVLNSVVLLTLQQLIHLSSLSSWTSTSSTSNGNGDNNDRNDEYSALSPPASSSSSSPFGLTIPRGRATPLPSIRISDEEDANINRNFYGGKNDKPHLGGFTSFDPSGVSPTLWKHMINTLGMRSLLDLGCGRGISTTWFVLHGLEYVVCAEGSHDAVEQSLLPAMMTTTIATTTTTGGAAGVPNGTSYELVEHDFSRGAWWPDRTVDVAWCVEFTEHVGRNFMMNYHTAFRKAALIFATHSNWGGWHHVEVHDDNWWRTKMESSGFVYSAELTHQMRTEATKDVYLRDLVQDMIKRNQTSYAVGQHLRTSLQVFINPLVASLPEHQHLFAEHGCFPPKGKECGTEGSKSDTPLPESFKPLKLTQEMDDRWMDLIRDLPLVV